MEHKVGLKDFESFSFEHELASCSIGGHNKTLMSVTFPGRDHSHMEFLVYVDGTKDVENFHYTGSDLINAIAAYNNAFSKIGKCTKERDDEIQISPEDKFQITPEDVFKGSILWSEIKKMDPYHQAALMISVLHKWGSDKKSLAIRLGISDLNDYFAQLDVEIGNGRIRVEDLQTRSTSQYYNVVEKYVFDILE